MYIPSVPLATLGNYQLVALLGEGGMSDVYLAATTAVAPIDFTKLVALKRLRGDYFENIELVTMFLDEARIAARLNHPNVVQTHEVDEVDGEFFLSMEYLEGETLARIRQRTLTEIPLGVHLAVLCETLSGIDYAHNLKDYDGTPLRIVHRDVTPQNIFVTFDGRVKVMDFGIAMAAGRIAETRHGVIKGKVQYMAPEQAMVDAPIDHRADIFAVGVMLYEACVRQRMWKGVTEERVLPRLRSGDIPTSIQDLDPALPDDLEAICAKALAFEPDRRYASAAEFQTDLDAFIDAHERRPSPRQLGELVGNLFADQRKSTQEIVESQMAMVMSSRALRRSGRFENVALPSDRISRSNETAPADLRPIEALDDLDESTKITASASVAPNLPSAGFAPASRRVRHMASPRVIVLVSMVCVLALTVLFLALRA